MPRPDKADSIEQMLSAHRLRLAEQGATDPARLTDSEAGKAIGSANDPSRPSIGGLEGRGSGTREAVRAEADRCARIAEAHEDCEPFAHGPRYDCAAKIAEQIRDGMTALASPPSSVARGTLQARLLSQAEYMADNPPATIETDSPVWREAISLLREAASVARGAAADVDDVALLADLDSEACYSCEESDTESWCLTHRPKDLCPGCATNAVLQRAIARIRLASPAPLPDAAPVGWRDTASAPNDRPILLTDGSVRWIALHPKMAIGQGQRHGKTLLWTDLPELPPSPSSSPAAKEQP